MAGSHGESEDGTAPLLPTSFTALETQAILDKRTSFLGYVTIRNLALISGPLATLVAHFAYKYFVHSSGEESDKVGAMLGVLLWMACWWMLAPIPLAITSLLPLVLFPFFGIMDSDAVSAQYTNSVVVLLIGTFILALSIQKYNLHRRVALIILMTVGGEDMNPSNIILGFLGAASFVSMWMSDTVAALMMLPVAVGVLNNLTPEEKRSGSVSPVHNSHNPNDEEIGVASEQNASKESSDRVLQKDAEELRDDAIAKFGKGLLIAVTYGTALGGMATLIGSGPNIILPGFYSRTQGSEHPLTFLSFCLFAIPLLIPYFILCWLFLVWYFCPPAAASIIKARLNRRMVVAEYEALGLLTFPETVIVSEYMILIVLWITRVFGTSPGWGVVFNNFPSDGTVSVLAAISLFLIPNKQKDGEMIMDWKSCKELSWNVILLVGGGFALSKGIQVSGLAELIGVKMQFLELLPNYLITPVIVIVLSIVTEFSSNVSVASLFLPLLGSVADSTNIHPLLLMVPATFACNFSYNLPSATPPNAICLASGHVKVKDMAFPGLFMHLMGLLLMSIFVPTLGAYVFGLNRDN